jgi:hypothetical protein
MDMKEIKEHIAKMTKLTKKQKELMGWVNKVDEPGTWENQSGAFYCECGIWKPWDVRTVESLKKKNLVEVVEGSDYEGWYLLKPKK